MCVIAVKPSGVRMPDSDTIARMWAHNPDGAGIMYAHAGKVRIDKGYMTLNDFSQHVKKLSQSIDLTKSAVIMHFRITTHGGTKPENCHPFPLSGKVTDLQRLHTTARIGVAHNGIIPIKPRQGISDTMEYIATQLAPLYAMNKRFLSDQNALDLIQSAIKSKMAFLTGANKYTLIGQFFEVDGILYSNLNHDRVFTYRAPATPTNRTKKSEAKPTPKTTMLMAADDLPYGAFAWFVSSGELTDDLANLFIDQSGRVYSYAPEDGLCYPDPNIRIYDGTSRAARYNPTRAAPERIAYTYADMHAHA